MGSEELVKCVYVWLEAVWGGSGLGLGYINPVERIVLDVCRCLGCGGVYGGLGLGYERVMLCMCELSVWIMCVYCMSMYLHIVLGGYLRILGAPSDQSCCTLSMLPTVYLYVADIANPFWFAIH